MIPSFWRLLFTPQKCFITYWHNSCMCVCDLIWLCVCVSEYVCVCVSLSMCVIVFECVCVSLSVCVFILAWHSHPFCAGLSLKPTELPVFSGGVDCHAGAPEPCPQAVRLPPGQRQCPGHRRRLPLVGSCHILVHSCRPLALEKVDKKLTLVKVLKAGVEMALLQSQGLHLWMYSLEENSTFLFLIMQNFI